jgi:2'-5' RNA ligase
MKRIFIGIPLGENIADEIEKTFSPLSRFQKDFFWIPKQNWHITLSFLGDVVDSQLAEIQKTFSAYSSSQKYFNIYFNGLVPFPERAPKKLVLTMVKNRNLMDLQYGLRNSLKKYLPGEELGKKFMPHVSVINLRRGIDTKEIIEKAKTFEFKKRFEVDTISCIESVICDRPPVEYKVLSEAKMVVGDKFDPENFE